MALIACPECGGQLSTTAEKCPHCGRPNESGLFTCYECKAKVSASVEYCPECGCPLNPKAGAVADPGPPNPSEQAQKACPGCDKLVAADAAVCPHCGEDILGRVLSYCPACQDEYIVDEAVQTFSCPRCKTVCDTAEGARLLKDLAIRQARRQRRNRFLRPNRTAAVEPESPAALVLAILGLFVPILAIVALVLSKRGSPARLLAIIDLSLAAVTILLVLSMAHR